MLSATAPGQDQLCLSFEEQQEETLVGPERPALVTRKEALAAGLKYYFTGKACKRGHVVDRYVSHGACVECHLEAAKKAYWADPDASRASDRKWRECHLEAARATTRAAMKKWRGDNPDAARASNRAANKKHYRANTEAHIERATQRKRNIKHRTLWGHSEIIAIRKQCRAITKSTGIPHHVDHILPIEGKLVCGLNVPENLRIITAAANLSKSNKFDIGASLGATL